MNINNFNRIIKISYGMAFNLFLNAM